MSKRTTAPPPEPPAEPDVTSAEPAEVIDVLEQWRRESIELAAIPAHVLTECGVRNGMSRAEILSRCRGRY
jgi:hypothetical protein